MDGSDTPLEGHSKDSPSPVNSYRQEVGSDSRDVRGTRRRRSRFRWNGGTSCARNFSIVAYTQVTEGQGHSKYGLVQWYGTWISSSKSPGPLSVSTPPSRVRVPREVDVGETTETVGEGSGRVIPGKSLETSRVLGGRPVYPSDPRTSGLVR